MILPVEKSKSSIRGAFILFEGCDRAGKSTQAAKLFESLDALGVPVKLWKFPDRTTLIGHMIDKYLKSGHDLDDRAIHLLFSANRWECKSVMKDILLDGTTLIVDRYAYSGVAYSAAKDLELEWCKSPDIGLLTPDIVFFMDMKAEEAAKRGGFGEELYEKKEFQEKVRDVFMLLKERTWETLDARKSVTELYEHIGKMSLKIIQECKGLPLKEDLWKS
ncbi:15838_t:CDS:2 [Acaulospora morrowiae]|uniref:Thymidylate kinase n=1 Tax=Acaulospora morrowiae TaxID=94023 RepID=A0A9N9IEV3_9GLOM|nr:15838_t:CDS:2 [Acaulospora morrowiae]